MRSSPRGKARQKLRDEAVQERSLDVAASEDGRVQRGARNRSAIVEALFELIGEGELSPTAQQVAGRAQVGLRSVFRHFSDMESLFAAVDERLLPEAAPLLLGSEPRGDIVRRAREMVLRRIELFEYVAPYKRAANRRRAASAFLESRHRALLRNLRRDLLRWLPELSRSPDALVDALDFTLSFESWDSLRSDRALSRPRAHAAVEHAVLALVAELEGRDGRSR
jgi:AcrR family transcriptional regulator